METGVREVERNGDADPGEPARDEVAANDDVETEHEAREVRKRHDEKEESHHEEKGTLARRTERNLGAPAVLYEQEDECDVEDCLREYRRRGHDDAEHSNREQPKRLRGKDDNKVRGH